MPGYAPGGSAVMRRGPQQAFTPLMLGAALYDCWDAENPAAISLSGSAVTAWASTKNGYSAAQAVGAARPVYSATSFNGRPGVTFDGSDDLLVYVGVGVFPTGASPCEIWVLFDQTALVADTTARRAVSYGSNSNGSRWQQRAVVGGVNKSGFLAGNGTAPLGGDAPGDYSGRHVSRGIFSATDLTPAMDGSAASAVAVVPATGTTQVTLGASNAGANFGQGVASWIGITAPLTAPQAAQMLAYLKARGGIA